MGMVVVYPRYLQRKANCAYCLEEMPVGSQAIKLGEKGYWWRYCFLHPECAMDYINKTFEESWWEWFISHEYENKLGRKPKRTSPMMGTRYGHPVQTEVHLEVRRLKALRRYHKKALNEDKVEAITNEIARLEAGDGVS